MDDDAGPMDVGDNKAPFSGPDPEQDEAVSLRPETDSDIDQQELYDAGLASAAELHQDDNDDPEDADLPDGFHIEE